VAVLPTEGDACQPARAAVTPRLGTACPVSPAGVGRTRGSEVSKAWAGMGCGAEVLWHAEDFSPSFA